MAGNNSQYAAMTKARARFGRFLTREDYAALCGCKTVPEVAAMLREYPDYSPILSGVLENMLHRGNLEILLERELASDLAGLLAMDASLGSNLYRFAVTEYQIRTILGRIRSLNADSSNDLPAVVPAFYQRHSEIDYMRLFQARTFDDLLAALQGTSFFSPTAASRADGKTIDIASLENKLYHLYYAAIQSELAAVSGAADRKALTDLFGTRAELFNLEMILRTKRNFNTDPGVLFARLYPFYYKITPQKLREMCMAESDEEVFDLIGTTAYRHDFAGREEDPIYLTARRIVEKKCIRSIRYSVSPAAVVAAYVYAARTQLDNITTVIEGVRYGLPGERILSLIVITEVTN